MINQSVSALIDYSLSDKIISKGSRFFSRIIWTKYFSKWEEVIKPKLNTTELKTGLFFHQVAMKIIETEDEFSLGQTAIGKYLPNSQ